MFGLKKYTVSAVAIALVSMTTLSDEAKAQFTSPRTTRTLEGTYTVDGYHARVQQDGSRFVFTNELGRRAVGVRVSRTRVVARDWDLAGTISEGSIFWDNGAVWCRGDHCLPLLSGRYRFLGWAAVEQSGPSLRFINEKGEPSRGRFLNATQVVAIDWNNLVGTVDANSISWANGDTWVGDYPDISGAYQANGERVHISQRGKALTFVKGRSVSAGIFLSPTTVQALDWNRQRGTLRYGRIEWRDGTTWSLPLR